jgi:hypothetical protein
VPLAWRTRFGRLVLRRLGRSAGIVVSRRRRFGIASLLFRLLDHSRGLLGAGAEEHLPQTLDRHLLVLDQVGQVQVRFEHRFDFGAVLFGQRTRLGAR